MDQLLWSHSKGENWISRSDKILIKKKERSDKIKTELTDVYDDAAFSLLTTKSWTDKFKCVGKNIIDEDSTNRPKEVTTSELILNIYEIVINTRRVKVSEVVETTAISTEWV